MKIKVGIRKCEVADRDHLIGKRVYAHTWHRKPTKRTGQHTICVASAFFDLPYQHKMGIIAHEVGHILIGRVPGEDEADTVAEEYFGIKMYYQDTIWGKDLEWVTSEDADKVWRKLNLSQYLFKKD